MEPGLHLTQIVGSEDAETLLVRLQPPEQAWLDVGHADIWQAPASRELFWEPVLAWIEAH